MALDARTGKRLWHQQLVHHDLWDYDLPQAPKLLTIRQNGRNVDVVAQATKHGFLFVFERKTGKPILPIEERPVPQSDVPGEQTSPTQPFPTKPAPFARQSFTEKDINPYLPEAEQELLRQRLRSVAQRGPVHAAEPRRARFELPGHNGGANWGSSAVDPVRGEFYVVSKNMPAMLRLVLSNEEPTAGGALGGGPASPIITPEQKAKLMAAAKEAAAKGPVRYTSPYDFMLSPTNGMTAIGPPWSQITAYDLNTGEIKWRVPHGGVTAPPEVGIPADIGRAHAARRAARDGRRPRVRGHRVGSHRARLRPRQRQGGVDERSADRLGRRAGDLRGGRPPVHRVPRRGGSWIVPGSLRRSRGGCEWWCGRWWRT